MSHRAAFENKTPLPARPALPVLLAAGLLSVLACACSNTPASAADPSLSPAFCSYEDPPAPSLPGAPTASGALMAGTGEAQLGMPVGTPLGGYTGRVKLLGGQAPDARQSARSIAFVPSGGVQTPPMARAVYLQNGEDRLLLVKTDLCASSDRLVYDLEKALDADRQGQGQQSMRGKVIVTASHSHSAWATYQEVFHLLLGFDVFQETQYQRLLASLVHASQAAIKSARPARLGVGVWDGWDPNDEVFSNRRGEEDKLPGPDGKPRLKIKDDRLTVLRLDDDKSKPMAILFHFPMHGTISGGENPLASVDSTGHVELALEEYFDSQVVVMHLQGPAGDQSPRGRGGLTQCDGKKQVCTDFARMESLGEIAAPRIFSLWQGVQTAPSVELEVLTRAVPNGRAITVRDGMKYAPFTPDTSIDDSPSAIYDEAGKVRSPITQFNVPSGAGLCGNKAPPLPVNTIDGARHIPYASCLELASTVAFIGQFLKIAVPMLPDCPTTRTTLTAVRLSGAAVTRRMPGAMSDPPVYQQSSEDLLFATLPGEPVTTLAEKLRAKSPFGPDRTFVLGYAQGHMGYILDVENWLLGGYEPSINIYGPLEGEWLMERSLELLGLAATKERDNAEALGKENKFGVGRLKFQLGMVAPPVLGAAEMAGQPVAAPPANLFTRTRVPPADGQPAAAVMRVSGRATFVFYGGDPEEGTPQITLEHQVAGAFAAVQRRSGRALDTRGKEMILTYTPQPIDAAPGQVTQHLWTVEWQAVGWERDASSLGTAGALSAPLGTYRFSVTGKAASKDYQVQSRPFMVVADGALKVSGSKMGPMIAGTAVYPVGAGYRQLRLGASSDGDVPAGGMLQITVKSHADNHMATQMVAADATGGFTLSPANVDLSQGADVTVSDSAGNNGLLVVN